MINLLGITKWHAYFSLGDLIRLLLTHMRTRTKVEMEIYFQKHVMSIYRYKVEGWLLGFEEKGCKDEWDAAPIPRLFYTSLHNF